MRGGPVALAMMLVGLGSWVVGVFPAFVLAAVGMSGGLFAGCCLRVDVAGLSDCLVGFGRCCFVLFGGSRCCLRLVVCDRVYLRFCFAICISPVSVVVLLSWDFPQ